MESTTFIKNLRNAASFLNPESDSQLISDIETVCQQLVDSSFRIAVVAPFNFGKSTLINALLGQEVMPSKCIRTTGLAISIKYGKKLKIWITLSSGEVIRSSFVEILEEYVVLDKQGNIRKDVISVEVFYPHPLLKRGVELLDLPGINDTQEQNQFVKDELLQVDLVILILHAQQLFTLTEQDILNQWLVNRGIKNIVFVINWMNKLKNRQDYRDVYDEAQAISNDFKSDFQSDLTHSIKSLYPVDALPALKAKKNGSIFSIWNSGLARFEASLHTIYSLQKAEILETRCPRAKIITQQVLQTLQDKAQLINNEIKILEQENNNYLATATETELLLKTEFDNRVAALRNWLTLSNLKISYHFEAVLALQESNFHIWNQNYFKPDLLIYQQALEKQVVNIAKELNKNISEKLYIDFPRFPKVERPNIRRKKFGQKLRNIFTRKSNNRKSAREYNDDLWRAYEKAVNNYFAKFSQEALKNLAEYEQEIQPFINLPKPPKSPEIAAKNHELQLLNNCLEKLRQSNLLKSKSRKKLNFNQDFWLSFVIFIKYFILTIFWSKVRR
ncbi:MAG: dynamin family protein [Xenococcus sp. MO_188.B8]|nr:dynamin family protein [Xenococcus sp. MO_188.B8]